MSCRIKVKRLGRNTQPIFFMRRIFLYLVLGIVIFLALIPPMNFFITRPENDMWFMLVLGMGFLGFYLVFIRTEFYVKVIGIGALGLSILCGSPLTALTAYFSIVLCCYLYVFARRIKNWKPVFRFFQTLLFLNVFVEIMQILGRDSLLNFGLGHNLNTYGIIGQHMQMGSFSVVLSAVLLSLSPVNLVFPFLTAFFCHSAWTLFCAACGLFILVWPRSKRWAQGLLLAGVFIFGMYTVIEGKIQSNVTPNTGRMVIWKTSLQIAGKHPWVGWGAGTYKLLYPSLSRQKLYPTGKGDPDNIPYKTAHNWLVQMIFEMGYPFTLLILSIIGAIAYGLYQVKEFNCLAGLTMIFLDGLVHFPDRMLQTVGIIIVFLAYCVIRLRLLGRCM